MKLTLLNHLGLMKKNEYYPIQPFQSDVKINKIETEGYPLYPENEDIYIKFKKEIIQCTFPINWLKKSI